MPSSRASLQRKAEVWQTETASNSRNSREALALLRDSMAPW